MTRSAADLAALKTELTTDPKALGLTVLPADDAANADKLNAVKATTLIKRRWLTTAEILNAIDPIEHQGLSEPQARWLSAVLLLQQIDPFKQQSLTDGVEEMFSPTSTSLAAFTAILTEPGNRIDQMYQAGLLEVGGTVTPSDVAQARQLP
jgi:hypothetical protein